MMVAALEFLVPGFLAATAAAALPVIIHLIHRRRTRVIDFSTLRFLKLVERRIARRRRLENWWVLLLRILVLLFVALSLAGPVFRTANREGRLSRARVLVVDNSYSMDLVVGGTSQLERALAAAGALLDDLEGGDLAAVVPLHPRPLEVRLFRDHERSRAALAAIRPSPGATPLAQAVRPAIQALLDAPTAERELILLTDLQADGARPLVDEGVLEGLKSKVRVTVLQPPARKVKNLTVAAVEAVPEPGGAGRGHRVLVTVLNQGDLPATAELTLRVNDRTVATHAVNVAPGAAAECALVTADPGPGPHPAVVELTRDDVAADDRRPFVLHGRRTLPVLVARNSASHIARLDPAYYLVRALRPGDTGTIEPTVCRTDELARFDLTRFAVVVLVDPDRIPDAVVPALLDHVRSGGGLLLVCGPTLNAAALNDLRVAAGKAAGRPGDPAQPDEPTPLPVVFGAQVDAPANDQDGLSLGDFDRRHPVLRNLFTLNPPVDLTTPRFYRHQSLDIREGQTPRVLARFSSGRPALVEMTLGRGRFMVFASTLSPEWNDLPYKVSFLPLVHALVHALARKPGHPTDWEVLRPVVLNYPPGTPAPHRVTLTGHGVKLERTPKATGRGFEVTFPGLTESGLYVLSEGVSGHDQTGQLAVHVDPAEGDLTRLDRKKFPAELVPLADPASAAAALGTGDAGFSLALPLLLAALACLLAEGYLTARIALGGPSS